MVDKLGMKLGRNGRWAPPDDNRNAGCVGVGLLELGGEVKLGELSAETSLSELAGDF